MKKHLLSKVKISWLLGIASLFILILLSANASAQKKKVRWEDMGKNENATFYDVQKAFYKKWTKRRVAKEMAKALANKGKEGRKSGKEEREEEGYEIFKRWENFMKPRVYPSGNMALPYTTYTNYTEWLETRKIGPAARGAGSQSLSNWTALGPFSKPSGYDAGIGRVDFVKFLPGNSNTMFIGTPDGGLWKSTNSGGTWTTNNTDFLPVIGVADLAIDHVTTSTMYIATGSWESDKPSVGVLKSTDGGANWVPTSLVFTVDQLINIRKMVMHPTDPLIMIAATKDGVYRTNDGWATNTKVIASGNYYDIKFKPGTPATVYASGIVTGGSVIKVSSDGGVTWATDATGLPTADVSRVIMGVSANNSSYVYALLGNDLGGYKGLYRSTNSGSSFSLQSSTPNILNSTIDGDNTTETGGQATHNLAIAVSPTDVTKITIGGISQWRSTDGGVNWSPFTYWFGKDPAFPSRGNGTKPYIHADVQAIEYLPGSSTTMFTTCDGGISKTTNDGVSWLDISNNLSISQETRVALSATSPYLMVTGLQDIGTLKNDNGSWSVINGGDGEDAFIDRTNNSVVVTSNPNGSHALSTDGGVNRSDISGLPAGNLFFSPISQDPNTATLVYAGGRNPLYKSTGVLSNASITWTTTAANPPSISGANAYDQSIIRFKVAPSNSNVIYVIKYKLLSKTTDGGANWTDITGTLPVGSAEMTNLTVSNTDPLKVWVTFSGYSAGNKVYKSVDGGTSWTNVSSGLPNIPFNTIVYVNGSSNDQVYTGGDVGVYYRDNGASDWALYNIGLPNCRVNDLEIYYGSGKLRAATYGRGTWESDINVVTQTYYRTITSGDWNSTSTWESSTDNVTFNAAAATPNSTDKTVTVQAGHTVTVTANVTIDETTVTPTGAIAVGNGITLTVINNGLVFKSDATGTARIAPSAGGVIAGNVTVERFIPAGKRAYRQLASGVNTVSDIRTNWQNGGNYVAGKGMHITGSAVSANGFDATQTGAPSLFKYIPGATSFEAIPGTNGDNKLQAMRGYRVFVFGDRNADLTIINNSGTSTPNIALNSAVTLSATGSVITGTVTYNGMGATVQGGPTDVTIYLGNAENQFSLIGNPYISPVDFDALSKAFILPTYWIWDPTIGNRGAYVSWTTGSGSSNPGSSAMTKDIQSGQAIFVKNESVGNGFNDNASLVFTEANKTAVNTNTFRNPTQSPSKISIQLFTNTSLANSGTSQDGTVAAFRDDFIKEIGNEDAPKFTNTDENIAILNGVKTLGIDARPTVATIDTLPVRIWQLYSNNQYTLKLTGSDFDAGMSAALLDKYLNTSTELDMAGNTNYPFSFTGSDSASYYNRFFIVVSAPIVLPVNITSVIAYRKNSGVQVGWNIATETDVDRYEIERSTDSRLFKKTGSVNAKANNNLAVGYNWFDADLLNGEVYYRIKAISKSGEIKYSEIVKVRISKDGLIVIVSPNPVRDGVFQLQMSNLKEGKHSISLYSNSGQQVYSEQFTTTGEGVSRKISPKQKLASGVYSLVIKEQNGKVYQQKVVFEK